MLKFLAEKISTHLLSIIGAALTPVVVALAIFFRQEITDLVKGADHQSLAILLVSLALACLALFAWVLYLLPSFKYVPKFQVYQHRVNGLLYCPPCRDKKPLSPLKKEISGWRCPFKECGQFYKDPDYKKPEPPPPQDLGPHRWMAR
jgi:hypothetical protein